MASFLHRLEEGIGGERAPGGPNRESLASGGESVFALANAVDTRLLLDRYGVEHDDKHARCPGCGESGALICDGGGLKCLHNRCADAGPPNHPGLRLNVDLVAAQEQVPPLRAAQLVCQWFGIAVPKPLSRSQGDPLEWGAPIPLGEQASHLRFPIEALPGALRAWVEAEALATQTPCDLPAVVALATVSACVAKKVEVEVRRGWTEPLNTYWLVALEPGNRKSTVFRDAVAPLHRYEKASRERLGAPAREAATEQKIKERQVKMAIERAARSGLTEDTRNAVELAVEMDSKRVPLVPRLVVDDVTPERLASLLAEQGGRLAIMSAEGGLFDTAGGRYSEGIPNLDVYLKAHPGDDLRVDRIGREPIHVRKPALTLGIAVQPEVIRDLAGKRGFRGTGLLARFFYALPESLVGTRQISPPAVPDNVSAAYDALCSSLIALPERRESDGELMPSLVRLDADARDTLERFAEALEGRLGNGGDLAALSDWANKLVGGVARIAGLLHLAGISRVPAATPSAASFGDLGDFGEADQTEVLETIGRATVNAAIEIAHYLLDHVQVAFALMGADPNIDHARRLISWVRRTSVTRFSKRDAWQASKGYFKKAAELDVPLSMLCEHGYLREEPQEHAGPGRRPGSLFAVNPHTHHVGDRRQP